MDVPRSQLAVYVAAAIAIALLGARYVSAAQEEAPPPGGTPAVQVEEERSGGEEGGRAVVHVAGAVREPGVYRLREGDRVADAVDRAGGATGRADLTLLNLAAEVEDGRQVVVPERGAAGSGAVAGGGGGGGGAAGTGATGGAQAPPINLNTATLEQLDTLEGVGPGIAQRILDYRDEQGSFGSVDELGQVPGIGEKRMAALRDKVTV
ncbi:MAG: helix-hairpin-helix domain-containing protein [Solirubrobacteraceae bacterium MAG38_C4-C5]|nr:helix-hairpin-helix domain-containing protein [Candidatus Siliceabacter maunaloa]